MGRQSRAEIRGRYTVRTRDGSEGGEQLQEPSCSRAHFPGAGSRRREGAESDSPQRLPGGGVSVRGAERLGGGTAAGDPWEGLCGDRRGLGSGEAGKMH